MKTFVVLVVAFLVGCVGADVRVVEGDAALPPGGWWVTCPVELPADKLPVQCRVK